MSCYSSITPKRRYGGKGRKPKPLINWKKMNARPWHIVLLLGGGFAVAATSQESGLSKWIGERMAVLSFLPPWCIVLIVSAIVAALTEVTSNTATTTIMLPILAHLAVELELNPLFLMLPATVSASFAFMLPGATPPNAIVFSDGFGKYKDMMIAGFVMNLICIATVTWCKALYGLDTFPQWGYVLSASTTTSMVMPNTTLTR